jgi:AhpC/TSA family
MVTLPGKEAFKVCHRNALLYALLAWASLTGCRRDLPVDNTVQGIVTYGEAPLREGRVTFLGDNGKVGAGLIESDGTYRILNPPQGPGRVVIMTFPKNRPGLNQATVPAPKKGLAFSVVPPRPEVRLPERFMDPLNSGLTFFVKPGAQTIDIRLGRGPDDPPVVQPEELPKVGLRVGQQAAEIEGEDIEGRSFKLSDYRGQVVVLLFWGHW